ncbi:MAG: acyl-CoA desaturase [Hellea sp.]
MKILWYGGMIVIALALTAFYFTWSALFVFLSLTYFTLLIGHSVGMHRMMIHRTFRCAKPLERLLIYIGVLVSIGGPTSIIKMHDTRDWAQRQKDCHDFFSHRRSYFRDVTWQLFYKFKFESPPYVTIEKRLSDDPWIQFFDKTWRFHQVILAGILFVLGGLPWVVWGVCLRVAVSTIGHWSITYICHNPGPGKWYVKEAGVQASNIDFAGFLTHGECWHNNHHAFPESARIGLDKGQTDPAWWVINTMRNLGLATHVNLPRDDKRREDLSLRQG